MKIEFIKIFRSKLTFITIAFVFVLCISMVSNVSNMNALEKPYAYDVFKMEANLDSVIDLDYELSKQFITQDEYDAFKKIQEEWEQININAIQAANEEDWQQYNYNAVLSNIYYGEYGLQGYGMVNDTYDYLANKEAFEKIKDEYLPNKEIVFPNTQNEINLGKSYGMKSNFVSANFNVQYFDALYKHHVKPQNVYAMGSIEIYFHYLNMLFPLLSLVLVICISFEAFSMDKTSGFIKTRLILGKSRSNYIRNKIGFNILKVTLIGFIPIILISSCLFVNDKGVGANAPMLSNQAGFTSFDRGINKLAMQDEYERYNGHIDNTFYMGMIRFSEADFKEKLVTPDVSLTLVPLKIFLVQSFLLTFLFIVFITCLINLCMSLINNKVIALFVSTILCIIGYYTAPITNDSIWNMFHPFQYMNSTLIVGGTSSYSYLSGVCILIGYSIILYVINIALFKHKDIV